MSRPSKPARYRLGSHPGITDDLATLVAVKVINDYGDEVMKVFAV